MRTVHKEQGSAVAEVSEAEAPMAVGTPALPAQAGETSKPKKSAYEINELRAEYDELSRRIESARRSETTILADLKHVSDKELKIKTLLALTDEISGYSTERERATEILRECAEERSKLEGRAKSCPSLIAGLVESRGQIKSAELAAAPRDHSGPLTTRQ
jgi:chromosome segregation ATPase